MDVDTHSLKDGEPTELDSDATNRFQAVLSSIRNGDHLISFSHRVFIVIDTSRFLFTSLLILS